MLIGNDVIDLSLQKQMFREFKSKRLNQKIFSDKELVYIGKEDHLLSLRRWTMKEAAYKAYQRLHHLKPRFNPYLIDTIIKDEINGTVKIDNQHFYLKTAISADYIYSYIVTTNECTSLRFDSKDHLLKKMDDYFNTDNLSICKDEYNIPSIYVNGQSKLISITHHGDFNFAVFFTTLNC